MYDVQKCAAVPKNRCEKCIGPVMHEQMPAYTVYIGKTGAFYMKKWKTRGISLLLALVLITGGTTAAFPGQSFAENVEIESPAACLNLRRHLGVVSVSGRKREAIPAANITAFIWMRFL